MKRVVKKEVQKSDLNEKVKQDHLWDIIKLPIFVLALFSILTSFLPSTIYNLQKNILSFLSILISLGAFGYIGYRAVKIKNETKFALKAGAYAGAIIGFIGAVLGLILIYIFPDRVTDVISQVASTSKLEYGFVKSLMAITAWVNLILGPVFNGLVGAVFSWISALIFKKR